MSTRHSILYDVSRWRKNRTLLLLPATAFLIATFLTATLTPKNGGGTIYSLLAAVLYAVAVSLWTRQRFTFVRMEEGSLTVRNMSMTMRLPVEEMRRVRVAKLGTLMRAPERWRMLPRPRERWSDVEAVEIRLDSEATDLVKLRRLLGARCVIERDLILPVNDPGSLRDEIESQRPQLQTPAAIARAGQGRRGKRRR